MELFALWLIFAFVVALGASARGRSGAGWFLLCCLISPLLGVIFLIALPNLKQQALLEKIAESRAPAQRARLGHTHSRVTVERAPRPFEADGVFAGIPYRALDDGSIEAMMQGSTVRFRDIESFTKALS